MLAWRHVVSSKSPAFQFHRELARLGLTILHAYACPPVRPSQLVRAVSTMCPVPRALDRAAPILVYVACVGANSSGHRRESRTLKAQIPVLRKHACQHRFATFAGILVLGAFCPCSKFAQLGHGKVRAKGVPARHGRLYKKRTFRAYRLPKRCIFATLLKKRRRRTNGTEGRANGEA